MTAPRRLPDRDGRSFADLPALVERELAAHDRVALVYLDAFGWRFLERQEGHPLLRRTEVERWTSQFPSTTTAHTTTLATGLSVGVHGLYEWHVYEPALDRLITPLPFSFAGDHERETLIAAGVRPEDVYPRETLASRLGVPCHSVQPASIASSPVSRWLLRDSTIHAFETTEQGFAVLARALAAEERAYGTIYLGAVDELMHEHGPDDRRVDLLFARALSAAERAPWPAGTLVLLTADHGMALASPERSVYVNVLWPELPEHVARGADGRPLAPAGSARDLFLHVLPDRLDEVAERLGELLAGVADVEKVETLLAAGAFGPDPGDALRARLANLVVLAHPGEAVYWYEAGRFWQRFRGLHGGLSPEEMEIPLLRWVA